MRLNARQLKFLRELTSRSFYHFVKIFGSWNKQGGDISPVVHRMVCDFVSDYSIKRKGLAMPRNLRKTTICDRWYPIWRYLQNPNIIIMIGSETKDLACESVKWIKHVLMTHELLRAVYPELKVINRQWENRHTFSNEELELPRPAHGATAPTISSIGVGGAAQGRHVDLLCLTDIIGDKAMTSHSVMMDTILWCEAMEELLVEPNINNPNGSEILIDFTHWAIGDVYEYLQDKYENFQWRIVPALKVSDKLIKEATRGRKNIVFIQHPDQPIGETNFPDIVDEHTGLQRFSTEFYRRKQIENERVFWVQHMNMPHHSESTTNVFRHEWIKYYHIERDGEQTYLVCGDDKERFSLSDINVFGAIDPGGFATTGLKSTGSRCAYVIAGQASGSKKKFVLEAWTARIMRPSEFVKIIIKAHEKWRVRAWLVETIGGQEYIYKHLQEAAMEQGTTLPLRRFPKNATTMQEEAKKRRIANLITPFSDGCMYVRSDMKDLISEVLSFPGLQYDLLDALSMINQIYWTQAPISHLYNENKERYIDYLLTKTEASL